MANSNHHAFVVPVVLENHPDADRLSIVRVNAYTCVVATEDWQGIDKAVYIQPDTVVPDWPEFAFLKRNNSARVQLERDKSILTTEEYDSRLVKIEEAEAANVKNLRITARRLRGVQSFGMLWPVTECPLCNSGVRLLTASEDGGGNKLIHFIDGTGDEVPCLKTAKVGDDAWETMGLARYDPPLPDGSGQWDSAPDLPYLHEYDVENYYNWPNVFIEGEEVVATEKLDGTNGRFVYARDRNTGNYRQFCGGKETWWADDSILAKEIGCTPTNLWWKALRAHPWLIEFCKEHPDWIVYGEVFGNVQKLKYGVKPHEPNMIRIFDILKVNEFMDYTELEALLPEKYRAPVIYRGEWNTEKFKELSLGNSTFANHLREGIVVAPIKERRDLALGRVKLKLVSFDMLSKGR